MRRLTLDGPLRLLVLGAHADDVEIGAGATILRLLVEHPGSAITWVVASATPARKAEAVASATSFSADAATMNIIVDDLPDGRFPAVSDALKDLLESVRTSDPDIILAPYVGDAHQDHQLLAQTVWQTFRSHLVAAYEIPKYDGDLGRPNLFVDVNETLVQRKVDLLETHFPSQHGRSWWGPDTFRSILRLRGIEAATQYAEAFHCRKIVL